MTNEFRVLIVEDEHLPREGLKAYLVTNFPQISAVDTATNGADGARMAAQGNYGLIFTDNTMPVMTGIDMIRTIRADENIKPQPFIAMLSGDLEQEIQDKARVAGANRLLKKPCRADALNSCVGMALMHFERRSSRPAAPQTTVSGTTASGTEDPSP